MNLSHDSSFQARPSRERERERLRVRVGPAESHGFHDRRGWFHWITAILFLLVTWPAPASADPVIISEFQASNDATLVDEDGDYSDWIEFQVVGDAPVNLGGWYLTDDALNLTRWRFPEVTLAPGEFLVVFASGKDRAVAGAELHTNFGLRAEGEYLALVRPDGKTVTDEFAPQYPPQREDVSYGREMVPVDLAVTGAEARVLIPRDGSLAETWTQVQFDDANWLAGRVGVGYDTAGEDLGDSLPVAFWSLDGTVEDLSGAERHGELRGPAYTDIVPPAAAAGMALSFDGVDDYVAIPGYPGVTGTLARTLAAWIRTSAGNAAILSWGTNSAGRKWTFRVQTGNGRAGAVRVEVNGGFIVGNTPVNDGQWHHVAAVLPERLGPVVADVLLFVDGRLDATTQGAPAPSALSSRPLDTASSENVRIGTDFNNRFFPGLIDEVAIWSAALEPRAIELLAGGASPLGLTSFHGMITTDVESLMRGINSTAYIRLPFAVGDVEAFTTLTLGMRYDDGFVAFLNGRPVAATNAPGTPTWNSRALVARPDFAAFTPEHYNLSAHRDVLVPGENVLSVQGLNVSAGDDDFLVAPELVAATTLPDVPRYFRTPTPGAVNDTGFIDFVANVRVTPAGGFQDDPIAVRLVVDTPGAELRYTTDGSAPTEATGQVYSGPIPIADTTTLRVAAFKDGYESSYVDTHTYIFLETAGGAGVLHQPSAPDGFPPTWGVDNGAPIVADYAMDPEVVSNTASPFYNPHVREGLRALPTMSIVMDRDDLFDPDTGIYSNSRNSGVAWERPASVEILAPFGDRMLQINCGIRIQGGASRLPSRPKHNLRLLFKKIYGPGKLRFRLFQDSPVDSFDTVILRGGNGDSWFHPSATQRQRAQYIRDQWARDTQLAMGRLSAHQSYMHLYLDGLYWGVYHLIERPSAPFLAAHLGGEREEYDAMNVGEAIDGNLEAWNTMMAIANAGLGSAAAYGRIQEYLDIPNLIDFLLVNFYNGNVDWDNNNWYGGRRRVPGAGYKFFCWDSERTFWNLTENRTGLDNPNRPTHLHAQLRANPEYRVLFADHVERHFFEDGALTPDAAAARWLAFAEQIELPLAAEEARWGDDKRPDRPYTRDAEWRAELAWLEDTYFPQRSGIVLQQLRVRGLYPTVEPARLEPPGGAIPRGGGIEIALDAPAGTIYYTLDGSDPRAVGGDVASTASLYRKAFVVEATTRVRVRVLRRGEWSALTEGLYGMDVGSLRITEIMYNPPAAPVGSPYSNEDFEFMELQNTGAEPLSLLGVGFENGVDFSFSGGQLAPGAFVLVVRNRAAFASRYDIADGLVGGEYGGGLDNGGERVRLVDALNRTLLDFRYEDDWYPSTDGGGNSLEVFDPQASPEIWILRANWRASTVVGGTPGAPRPVVVEGRQLAGDVNQDASLDISDVIGLLNVLFGGRGGTLPCGDGTFDDAGNQQLLDANDDGGVDVSDPIYLLSYLFAGGPPPVQGTDCVGLSDCPEACESI